MNALCLLCGQSEHALVSEKDRHGNALRSIVCLGCGVITNDPIPNDEELAAFYKKDYRTDYKGTLEPRMRQVWRNFGRLEKHIAENKNIYADRKVCLDLGSGSGEFMFLANAIGISCTGVEPNEGYAGYSHEKLGLNVACQTLEETKFPDGHFDLIRLSHVLEHMRDPVRSLNVLRRWLSDDGVLYIEVPNIEYDAAHKLKGRMFHFGHIFNFNPMTLRVAAGLAGFEEVPDVADRLAKTTGTFFRKNRQTYALPSELQGNAVRMKCAMDEHNARQLPRPTSGTAFGRLLSTLSVRAREVIAALRFKSHREIADSFAVTLKRRFF